MRETQFTSKGNGVDQHPAEPEEESFRQKVRADMRAWGNASGLRSFGRLALFEPGFQLALSLRIQEKVARVPLVGRLCRRALAYATSVATSSHIDPHTRIGSGVWFPHPTGVVIGGGAVVGKNVIILQGVTLGVASEQVRGGPVIEDGVKLYAGAKVLGKVTVGTGAVIGANAVILRDVPAFRSAVGVPARILEKKSP